MKPSSPGTTTSISKRRAVLVVVLFAIFGIGLHALASTFNGIKLAGLPLGYWLAAQFGPVVLALLLAWISARKVAP
jgi:putative solute:sodium symporter small subunit